jgi:hypothetical protein
VLEGSESLRSWQMSIGLLVAEVCMGVTSQIHIQIGGIAEPR